MPSMIRIAHNLIRFFQTLFDCQPSQLGVITMFDSQLDLKLPMVSCYLLRLLKHTNCSKEAAVLSFIYLERFTDASGVQVCFNNFHRLFLVALVLSIKYHDDRRYSNRYYALVGGVSLDELNKMESHFAFTVNFHFTCVDYHDFLEYADKCGYLHD